MAAVVIMLPAWSIRPKFKIKGTEPVKTTANGFPSRPQDYASLDCLIHLAHCQLQGIEQAVCPLLEIEGKEEICVNDVGWRLMNAMAMVAAAQCYEVTEDERNMCRIIFQLAKEALIALTGIEGVIAFLYVPTPGDREKWELVAEAILFDKFNLMGNLSEAESQLLADAIADPWTKHYFTAFKPQCTPPTPVSESDWLTMGGFCLRAPQTIAEIAALNVYQYLKELEQTG